MKNSFGFWPWSAVLLASMAPTVPTSLAIAAPSSPVISTRAIPLITIRSLRFRDLNRNGRLDPYEDWRLPPERRAEDLLRRMTLEEKAGTMMHGTLPALGSLGAMGVSSEGYDLAKVADFVQSRGITSFISRLTLTARSLAEQNNAVQRQAEATRLCIPITISTDPRSNYQSVVGAGVQSGDFSKWPDMLGFGALGDPSAVRRFAGIAREEYRAVGFEEALSPQADLATEPRWPRATGTFGSNYQLVSPLVEAYVEGFQGGGQGLATNGVMTVVKHWVGYGAEPDGHDGHNYYGRVSKLNDDSFAKHLLAFRGAFAARVSAVMPAYTIISGVTLGGRPLEPVGAGFNSQLLTDLLRGREHFNGIILSDWAITRDCTPECRNPTRPQGPREIGMPWGVEALSENERVVKAVTAGVDQFGGLDRPELIVAAVRAGKLAESRIDQSVRRILVAKFQQGLFENPFVDPARAGTVVGDPIAQAAADDVQRRSQVLLQNRGGVLPLRRRGRIYVYGLSADAVRAAGFEPAASPSEADFAIIRMSTPHELIHPNQFFGSRQNEGRLDFRDGDPDYEALKAASAHVPTVASIYLDRPAILTNVRDKAAVVLANFGASDAAVLDVLTGKARPVGRLPFELPSSMSSVNAQDPARPDDSASPLYPVGFHLSTR